MREVIKRIIVALLLGVALSAEALQSNLPLDQAARSGDFERVRQLIATGADPNQINKWGYSALTGACTDKAGTPAHTKIVQYLLAHGADVNKSVADGTTALLEASFWGHQDTVVVLLKAMANVNATKHNGFTPLISAAAGGHIGIVRLLLAAGADPNRQTSLGTTALHVSSALGHDEIVKVLLTAGARPDLTTVNGESFRDVRDRLKKR